MSKRDSLSVLQFPRSARFYLTHPQYFIRDTYRIIIDIYRRARYGWTYSDAWNFCDWFVAISPQMLRKIANDGLAYPGTAPFETEDKWRDWLRKMAGLIETADENWQNEQNKYYTDFIIQLKTSCEDNSLAMKYYNECIRLGKEGAQNIETALTEMSKYFLKIWD